MKKSKNLFLWIGSSILTFIFIISILAPWIAPYEIQEMDPPRFLEDGSWVAPPYPMSTKHWLGTDSNGYDILSQLMYGAKYTLLFISVTSVFRLLLALPIGMWIGWKEKKSTRSILKVIQLWNTLPILIIALLILSAVLSRTQSVQNQVFIQMVVIILLGVPALANTIHNHVKELKKSSFIEGAQVLGAGDYHILRKHIFPHLKPQLFLIWVMEIVQILLLVGQLAVLNIIIGGAEMTFEISTGDVLIKPNTSEWTGMLAISRYKIIQYPSIIIGPLIAYLMTIMSFIMVIEGLKEKDDLKQVSYELD